jgi:hypothetical protein
MADITWFHGVSMPQKSDAKNARKYVPTGCQKRMSYLLENSS